jgi:hypothetical protein
VTTTLGAAFAFAVVRAGAGILVTLEIFRGAGRSLLGVVEALQLAAVEVLADNAFEAAEFAEVFARDEGDGGTSRQRTAGTADAVDVVFELVREVEIEDVGDAVDVDTARGDIGRDEHANLTILEGLQGALTLALRTVGVDGGTADVFTLELAADAIGTMFGPRKDEHALKGFVLQEVVQHDLLEGARALVE